MATPQAQEDVIDAQQLALTEALAAAAGQAARRWALSHAAEAGGWAALDGTAEWVAKRRALRAPFRGPRNASASASPNLA